MRKISSFILFVFITGGLLYLLTSNLESDIDPVSLLPPDTIALLDLQNPAKSYAKFKRSRLGKQVNFIPWGEILAELKLTEEEIFGISTRFDEVHAILKSPLFRKIFGRRALFAFLPGQKTLSGNNEKSDLRDQVLLVCRPQHRASFLNLFASFFSGRYEYSSYSYMGKKIRKYSFSNTLSVYSTVTDGLVIIAFSEQPLKDSLVRSLHYMTGDRTGLDMNEEYRKLKKRAGGRDDQFFYAGMNQLVDILVKGEKDLAGLMKNRINMDKYPVKSPFRYFAFFRQPGRSTFNYTTILQVNPGNHEVADPLLFMPPVRNTTIRSLPVDLIAYFWTNLFNLNDVWSVILQTEWELPVAILRNIERKIFSKTGMSREQFLGLFGRPVSLNIAEIRTAGFFPLPRVCIRVELVDREGVENILETLLEGLPVRTSKVGSQDIYSIMLADGLMQPSYAFVGNTLVAADSYEQIIDVLENDKVLLSQDELYQRVDVGLSKPNNFILFLKTDQLLGGLKELSSLAAALLTMNGQKGGYAGKVVVEKILFPVLDGMKMYKANSLRFYYNESEIVTESALLVE